MAKGIVRQDTITFFVATSACERAQTRQWWTSLVEKVSGFILIVYNHNHKRQIIVNTLFSGMSLTSPPAIRNQLARVQASWNEPDARVASDAIFSTDQNGAFESRGCQIAATVQVTPCGKSRVGSSCCLPGLVLWLRLAG